MLSSVLVATLVTVFSDFVTPTALSGAIVQALLLPPVAFPLSLLSHLPTRKILTQMTSSLKAFPFSHELSLLASACFMNTVLITLIHSTHIWMLQ